MFPSVTEVQERKTPLRILCSVYLFFLKYKLGLFSSHSLHGMNHYVAYVDLFLIQLMTALKSNSLRGLSEILLY